MCLSFHVAVNAHIIYSFFYIYFKLQQHTEGIIDMMQMQVSLDLPFTYDDTVKTLSIFLGEYAYSKLLNTWLSVEYKCV